VSRQLNSLLKENISRDKQLHIPVETPVEISDLSPSFRQQTFKPLELKKYLE